MTILFNFSFYLRHLGAALYISYIYNTFSCRTVILTQEYHIDLHYVMMQPVITLEIIIH